MSQDLKSQPKNINRQAFFSFRKKIIATIFLLTFGALIFGTQNVKAQTVVTDPPGLVAKITQTVKDVGREIKTFWKDKLSDILKRAGSKAFQVTLRRALNKVAYDYATALGSGDWGQQPLFQARNWGDYFADIGNEAAGAFIEEFANDFSEESSKEQKEIGKAESAAYDNQQKCLEACPLVPPKVTGVDEDDNPIYEDKTTAVANCQSGCNKQYKTEMGPVNEKKKAIETSRRPIATCQPSSIDVKLKIALGLAQVNRPAAPNCSATEMINNWKTAADKYADFSDPDYLNKTLPNIFNPVSNDLGIALTLRSDLLSKQAEKDANAKLQASIGQGYTDKRNIAGNLISIPNKSRLDTEASGQMYADNFGKYTGDAFIDAANIFINQAALTAWNKLMASLAEKAKKGDSNNPTNNPGKIASGDGSDSSGTGGKSVNCNPVTDPSCAPVSYGEGNIQEAASVLIKPSFTTQADYDILPSLSTCVDPNNPGPTECVIDERFLQAVTEKKTVAEAIKENFLNKTWLLSGDSKDSNSYNIRNISILRKYRILPVGWEEAANKIAKLNKKASLMDLVSCFDPNDEYNEFGSQFDVRDQAWCEGLVDPNWVLKAPLNYCRKQGSGGQIRDLQIVPGQSGQGAIPDLPSSLIISRADEYCADEQSCIKEKADGSCEAYGYCNTEKRTWSFGQDSCEPIYNTCQTFTKTNGSSVSYLKNTLDYGTCNADNSGCQAYSWFGVYNSNTGQVAWDIAKHIYLNDKAGICSANEEGCTALYRVKPSWGANLIMNANFDNDQIGDTPTNPEQCSTLGSYLNDWYFRSMGSASNCNAEVFDASGLSVNGKALKLSAQSGDIGIYSGDNHSFLPDDFSFLSGQSYTFSADVYLLVSSGVSLWIGDDASVPVNAASTTQKGSWQHLSFTRSASDNINDPEFAIRGEAEAGQVEFYIKNLKFELSDFDTGYKLYGAYKVYEKVLPPYLEAACYVNAGSGVSDYTLKPNAPSICSNFARKCNKNEAGCELYSSLDNFAIPAQTVPADYCPGECLGYDTYVSKQSYFNSPAAENLIPKTARTCTAASVGCSEFTNLDETAQGGENKEYYSFLKQCIKPDPNACGDFYVWQNGNESGYQLQALSLKVGADSHPYTVENDSSACSEAIYNSLPGDPSYNPDCRQFYNKAGNVSYHLMSKTVSCSDECKTFRMSEKNIDATVLNQAACNASNQSWDAVNNVCYSCLSGGTWDNNQQACLYKAIPSEGTKCGAQDNGCREFNGNRGNNLYLVQTYDFENGLSAWEEDDATATSSPDSNNKDGSSVKIDPSGMGGIKTTLGFSINSNASYVIKFLAKAENNTKMRISLSNDNGGVSVFGPANPNSLELNGDNSWHAYQVNLNVLNHEVSSEEYLLLEVDNIAKLDNIVLQEISDKYYLIARSSSIPDICYYDMLDKFQGADYNLGCSAYSDRNSVQHNLHQFSRLCQDSAVGCEMMINTYNYSPYNSRLFNDLNDNKICDNNEPDCVKVKQDSIMYAVFDKSKQCNSADQGCALFGQAQKQGLNWYFNNVYKKNNPDNYDQSLCRSGDVGCTKWLDDNGSESYFKDPGLNACVYRNAANGSGKDWFRIPVKRCDLNDDGQIKNVSGANESAGSLCFSDTDCSNDHKCLVDNNDYSCNSSYLKTIGYGGVNNRIPTPDGSAGLCEATASGCTEYIDPVSKFSSNLVINPNFEDTNGDGVAGDGWTAYTVFGGGSLYKQTVNIQAGRLYKFYFSNPENNFAIIFNCTNDFRVLGSDNQFGSPIKSLKVLANNPLLFLSPINNTCEVKEGKSDRSFELKEAIVSYQKQNEVDQKSCNGVVNFENGCILFNERSQAGSKPLSLLGAWNASASRDKNSPATCGTTTIPNVNQSCEENRCYEDEDISFNTCNANKLIKVRPDRTCGAWLDCSSYAIDPDTKEKTCYAVSQCDRLDDKKECASFIKAAATSTAIHNFSFGSDKNSTGYSVLNKYYLPNMKEVGSDIGWHVDFESKATPLSCRKLNSASNSFENCIFDKNINVDSIVSEPSGAPTDYPANGTGYLKVLSFYQISPMPGGSCIPVVKGQDYYLNYLVNTKNSGAKAKIIVEKCSGGGVVTFKTESPDGWERRVNKISLPSDFSADGIKIFLSSDALDGTSPEYKENYVYFDDLNIEPVLKIGSGENDYVAKECRLYPGNDSLTCLSRGENVISDGLYGYCLEHDKNNKNVCLLWYPLDSISAGVNRNNKISGYKGIFPLNYCTEMNGNFNLLENRQTVFMGCFTHPSGGDWNRCFVRSPQGGGSSSFIAAGSNAAKEVGDFSWACNVGDTGSDATSIYYNQSTEISNTCGSSDYWVFKRQLGGQAATFCVPAFYNGWPGGAVGTNYPYLGQENLLAEKPRAEEFSCNSATDSFSMSEGWWPYNGMHSKGNIDESKNIENPIRVWDNLLKPRDARDLKFVPLSNNEPESNYNLVCNKFTQLVDVNGYNMAWVDRLSKNSLYPTSTTDFFKYGSSAYKDAPYGLVGYGRNRESIPFGAAILPANLDIFGLTAVKFRDQYSEKNQDDILAGRPYGCIGTGCNNIGYCSLDPNVFCLLAEEPAGQSYLASRSCYSGSYGTCKPLWTKPLGVYGVGTVQKDYENILKTLFIKSYSSYDLNGETYGYGTYNFNHSQAAPSGDRIALCAGNTRPVDSGDSFCAVKPIIEKVKISSNNNPIDVPSSGIINVANVGVYRLDFNTKIDKEQQPLRNIYINWGDGNIQMINNQDSRPSEASPHRIYHYYATTGNKTLRLSVYDNWGIFNNAFTNTITEEEISSSAFVGQDLTE